jgi:hypothetical protein
MDLQNIISQLDAEISKLVRARDVLTGDENPFTKLLIKANADRLEETIKSRFSASVRRKMALAQKRRWRKYHLVKRGYQVSEVLAPKKVLHWKQRRDGSKRRAA